MCVKIITATLVVCVFMSACNTPTQLKNGVATKPQAMCEKPEYPRESLKNEEQGTVTMSFHISKDGTVLESKIERSSGHPPLDFAAIRAISKCSFKPKAVDGIPVDSWTKMQYVWILEGQAQSVVSNNPISGSNNASDPQALRPIDHEVVNQDANLVWGRTVAHEQIERFAIAIRYAEAYQVGARAFLAKAAPPVNADDGKYQTIMRRVGAVPVAVINSTFVKALKKRLSEEDAQELADFFESPAGKKLAEASVSVHEMYTGNLSATINKLQLSNRERSIIVSFTQTDTYQKYQRFVASRSFGNLFLWELLATPEFADLKAEVKSSDDSKYVPGVFQITKLDPERAEIMFNASGSQGERQKEFFSVDRGVSVDIQNAVVTKMLDILVRQHLEHINWRSNVTGKVVLLSTKEQDRNATKKFLLGEFFHNYVPASSSNPR